MSIDGDDLFQAPKPVWEELKAKLVPAEVEEVVSILGRSQIDRNDELHREMATMLDILREYTAEVDGKAQQWRARFSRDANRDMLTTEIRSFISALRSKTSTPISLRPSTPHDRSVLGYVLPEHESSALLAANSGRHLLASRSGRPTMVPGESERPGTAEVAGRLAREIAKRDGEDADGGKLSLESMETEGRRFQQVLRDEEEELRRHIEFLHEVLDAEHERDVLHSAVPSNNDLKDLRDKLQTELSFATAEDKITKSNQAGGGGRLAPLAPLAHGGGLDHMAASLSRPLSGSLSRGTTALSSLASLPPSSGLHDDAVTLASSLFSPGSCLVPPANCDRGSGSTLSPNGVFLREEATARPLSRAAASMGLDLDSDEDDFLFGGEEDDGDAFSSRPRSKGGAGCQGADVLVLDDDDGDRHEHYPGARGSDARGEAVPSNRRKGAAGGPSSGAALLSAANRVPTLEKEGAVPVVDRELEEQSEALRNLLSGLVSRDTLADAHRAADASLSPKRGKAVADPERALALDAGAHAGAGALQQDAALPAASGVGGVGSAATGRRVRLKSLIRQSRSAEGAGDPPLPEAAAAPAPSSAMTTGRARDGGAVGESRPAAPRRAPLRAQPLADVTSVGEALSAGGRMRGLASAPGAAAPLALSGRIVTAAVGGSSPPTPPAVPRRPLGSAGERMPRPVYARPSSNARPMASGRSTLAKPNEA